LKAKKNCGRFEFDEQPLLQNLTRILKFGDASNAINGEEVYPTSIQALVNAVMMFLGATGWYFLAKRS
jgi:hypothetical protein